MGVYPTMRQDGVWWGPRSEQPGTSGRDDHTNMVYNDAMRVAKRTVKRDVRRSVTLPPEIARQVQTLAKQRRLSDNRVLVELIEQGIQARQQKERDFFEVAQRFRAASDPEEVKRLGDDLGRFVFGG